MKFNKRLFSLILAAILSVGCLTSCDSCSSCNKDNNEQTTQEGYKDTDVSFIENKKTDYVIVYPEGSGVGTKIAKAILSIQNLCEEATGVRLSAVSDSGRAEAGKIISLGKTEQANKNTVLQEKLSGVDLHGGGFIIETVDQAIYLYSKTEIGVLYAAYELMHIYFDFEYFAEECYRLEKDVNKKMVKDVHLTDVPDFDSRTASGADYSDELRVIPYSVPFNSAENNTFVHNVFFLVPPSEYMAEHPLWYWGTGNDPDDQLCLEAHGNAEERLALVDTVVAEMEERLLLQPDIDWISFSHNDGGKWCDCEACTALKNQYGSKTCAFISTVKFVNLVAEKIKKWNEEICPERDILIYVYDYGAVGKPPVKMDANGEPIEDENGNFIPLSEDFVLADNVAVYYCWVYNALSQQSVGENVYAGGEDFMVEAKKLSACMKKPRFYFWTYTIPDVYLVPYETISWTKDLYALGKQVGGVGFFNQGKYNVHACTDWQSLKNYVSAKLLWNNSLDTETLVKEFFETYYGEAKEVMRDFYNEYRAHMEWIREQGVRYASGYKQQKYWPYKTLTRFLEYVEKAYVVIEPLKNSNSERYEKLYDRILLESIAYKYLILQLYPSYFSSAEMDKMVSAFVADCARVNVTNISEGTLISSVYS